MSADISIGPRGFNVIDGLESSRNVAYAITVVYCTRCYEPLFKYNDYDPWEGTVPGGYFRKGCLVGEKHKEECDYSIRQEAREFDMVGVPFLKDIVFEEEPNGPTRVIRI